MKITTKLTWSALFICLVLDLNAQALKLKEVDLPVSKDAQKKGMYVTTTQSGDNIQMFIAYDLKKNGLGFDEVTVDQSGKIISNNSEIASPESINKYGVEIPAPDEVKNPAAGKQILRLVTANGILGKLKIERGYFEPEYAVGTQYGRNYIAYTKVLRGFRFNPTADYVSDMKLNIYAAHASPEDNINSSYNILEGWLPTTVGYLDSKGQISFIGKNAKLDKDSPNAQNVVITGKFDGKSESFSNIQEHVLEYNQLHVTNGYTGSLDRSVLISTLNAPSTISAHKKWQASGTPYMTYMTFNTEGNVMENVTFKSLSVRGNFSLFGIKNDHYVLGSVNGGHDGYYRADVGSPSHFQMVKISNGQVVAQESVSYDDIESTLLVTPPKEKGKLKFKDIRFIYHNTAPNGDLISCATTGSEYLIFQYSNMAQLKAVYLLGRVDGKELFEYGVEMATAGDEFYLLFREQAAAMGLGVSKSYSRSGSSYAKNVNFSRVDELMTYGRIVKINPDNKSISAPVDINDDVILGENAIFQAVDGGIMLPTRSSKNEYKMAIIK
ncbi:MAG: hypothetical protein RIC35_18120 [Marinoscillum sp.]